VAPTGETQPSFTFSRESHSRHKPTLRVWPGMVAYGRTEAMHDHEMAMPSLNGARVLVVQNDPFVAADLGGDAPRRAEVASCYCCFATPMSSEHRREQAFMRFRWFTCLLERDPS
jgi:hypothetical protein